MSSTALEAQTLISVNPLTGEAIGGVPLTDPAGIPGIVDKAHTAQREWGALAVGERIARLSSAAGEFAARRNELARLITVEMGKPLEESCFEVDRFAGDPMLEEMEEMKRALAPETLDDGKTRSVLYRDPLGVCASITPWNFPIGTPNWMVPPALVAGNSVVFKPSEETPLCGQLYADILGRDLPPGVLQVVHGADAQGRALVRSDVDLIAFTGSREVGKEVMAQASKSLKRVILELGGKDPLIVLPDADIERAAEFAAFNSFRNAGQVCVSTERIFVHSEVAREFSERLVQAARDIRMGDGLDPKTEMGPMVNASQRERVVSQIQDAVDMGAEIAAGARAPDGVFVAPTVLTGVTDEMAIAREETFGPVACVTEVRDVDEAVARANDTPFGLGAAVFGAPESAAAVARRLTAGMIGVNQGCYGACGAPWVGAKESGLGFHKSVEGHRQFAQTRVVSRATS